MTPEDVDALHKLQQERVGKILMEIHEMFKGKNSSYLISPLYTLPAESWEHQIRIKAERLLLALDRVKKDDEAMDCAVYCILYLARFSGAKE